MNTSPLTATSLVEARTRVAAIAEMLGADELRVLEHVADGLARGRSIYGELHEASDFDTEAAAEIRDSLAYLAAQLIRLHRRIERHTKGT